MQKIRALPQTSVEMPYYIYCVPLSPFRNRKPEFWDTPGWVSFKEDTVESHYAYFKGESSDLRREIGQTVPRGGGWGNQAVDSGPDSVPNKEG